MKVQYEKITPEIATKYMEQNTNNRPLKKRHIEFLTKEIKNGRWNPQNGSTIVFNGEKLIDGQHRMMAVINAGLPIESLVVRGAADDSFTTIDTGHMRTAGDVLGINGESNSTSVASATRFIMDYRAGRLFSRVRISNTEIVEYVEENPGIAQSVEYVLKTKGHRIIPVSLAAALHYLLGKKDQELADQLITGIFEGFEKSTGETFHALREKIIACQTAKGRDRADNRYLAIYIIKAWNARRKSKRMSKFFFGEKEEVPTIR